jgi:hypothetical protein
MRRMTSVLCAFLVCVGCAANRRSAGAAEPISCDAFHIDDTASKPLQDVSPPSSGSCAVRVKNGFFLPDPKCTPGATNPSLTVKVLRDPDFRTRCVRSHATSEEQKNGTYMWYNIHHPEQNSGVMQTCELDHLISLELGGADTLDNIWPQCGPPNVVLSARFFKQKDMVENFVAALVKAGSIDLGDAQRRIADDWTQFLGEAKKACRSGKCKEPPPAN